MGGAPRLTIGLPVHNGENFLRQSLDALLAQTYTDFELLISDNASTDGTQGICRDYARCDPRIRYLRQPRNIGAAPNHNLLVQQARGEFFKWAAHDDLFAPELAQRCIAVLDERPDVVLCHADMAIIDQAGNLVTTYDYRLITESPRPPERLRSVLFAQGGDDSYGVIRTEVLRRVAGVQSYHNPGRTLVAELVLHGPFHQVPELMYFRRDHPARGDRRGSIKAVCANLDPRRSDQTTARLVAEYLVSYLPAIQRAPLSADDRLRCYQVYAAWLAGHVFSPLRRAA